MQSGTEEAQRLEPTVRRLRRDEETALATQLREARETFAELLLALPVPWRRRVLQDDIEGPKLGRKWPLGRLEATYRRLQQCGDDPDGRRIKRSMREADRLKRRIDRTRDALVMANLPLVTSLAKRLSSESLPIQDLIQEGNLGLMSAVERFEPERGHCFSTYAVWWIRRGFSAVAERTRLIRLPGHARQELRNLTRATDKLSRVLGRPPTNEELADELSISAERAAELVEATVGTRPLERFGTDDELEGFVAVLADADSPDPQQAAMQHELRRHVIEALSVLSTRDRRILQLRFGIGCTRSHSLAELGEMFGLSREGVRRIQLRAIERIQRARDRLGEHLKPTTDSRPLGDPPALQVESGRARRANLNA
jgi:RNA polymerase sigma factor (sigma-70 family)